MIALACAGTARADFAPEHNMDEAAARAMLGRFGYGATPLSLAAAQTETPEEYLRRSIRAPSTFPPAITQALAALPLAEPIDELWNRLGPGGSARKEETQPQRDVQKEMQRYAHAAVQARLLAMANSDNQGHEILLAFWLNHFSIFAPKSLDKLLASDYVRAVEQATREDSFEALLRASFFHPAMQLYLDNAQSTAADSIFARRAADRGKRLGINENLARELLELHTLGIDAGYSQRDVQELARIITGAGVYVPSMQLRNLERAGATRRGLFLFDPRRHDYGEKVFLGVRFPAGQGLTEIDRALHIMATHPATARHIAMKLARRFLADDPPQSVIDAMTAGFKASGGNISATLRPLIASPEFAASLSKPTKFKEPMDFVLSAARAACGDLPVGNGAFLAAASRDMGEAPLMHTTPDGYGARESDWLSPAAMSKRIRFALGISAERLPLARGGHESAGAGTGAAVDYAARGGLLRGTPCAVDEAALRKAIGPVSPQTAAAVEQLPARQQAAFLLASPEFMRR